MSTVSTHIFRQNLSAGYLYEDGVANLVQWVRHQGVAQRAETSKTILDDNDDKLLMVTEKLCDWITSEVELPS